MSRLIEPTEAEQRACYAVEAVLLCSFEKRKRVALKLARRVFADAHLYAPSDGVIQDRILEPGDMADDNTPVYTLALVDPVWARTYVPEKELGKLHPGMSARITTDSHPGESFPGWVGFISPTAEFTPKAVETPELCTSLVYQVRFMESASV